MSDKKFIYMNDLIVEINSIKTITLHKYTIKIIFKSDNAITSIFESNPIAKNTFNRLIKALCDD